MEDTDLVPIENPLLDPTTPAGLQQRLTEYTQTRAIFMDWLMSTLVAGTDYMLIHRNVRGQPCAMKGQQHAGKCAKCGAKATLCKPGAEKIDGLLKLTPRFRKDGETWEMLGSPAGTIALVCELYTPAGQIVAEGRGVRNLDQDQRDENKCIKMCQKSAQIDATLRHAGLSEIFTLDLDDMTPQTGEAQAAAAFPSPRRMTTPESAAGEGGDRTPSPERSVPPARGATSSPVISRGQQGSLEASIRELAEAFGEDPADYRRRIHDRMGKDFGKESFKELTTAELTEVHSWVNQAWKRKHG